MDECPSCGARLAGAPSWCQRCLTRFDSAATTPAPVGGSAANGSVQAVLAVSDLYRAPAMLAVPTAGPLAAREPVEVPAAPLVSDGRSPVTPTVVKAILLGVLLQGVVFGLSRSLRLEPTTAVMLGLGLTVAFYLLVLSMVQSRLAYSGVSPVWSIGPPGTGLVVGVGVGALQALLVVGLTSAVLGRVASDDSATTALAQGGFVRVALLVALMVVAAPFIEELLFRGLLAESLRGRGRGAAIWLSALAFATWHLSPAAIRYYLLCGALLGLLYWKRGLVCSMAAHATFNGTLVVVAALSLSGPAHVVSTNGVTMKAPASWRQVSVSSPGASLELRNPSGAAVSVHRLPIPVNVNPADLIDRMGSMTNLTPDVTVKTGTVHRVQLPAGSGAQVDITDHGRDAEAVLLATPRGLVAVELVTGGNADARGDFDAMLQSMTLS
jgi:membrane protease YdiL (CAAX protease family)